MFSIDFRFKCAHHFWDVLYFIMCLESQLQSLQKFLPFLKKLSWIINFILHYWFLKTKLDLSKNVIQSNFTIFCWKDIIWIINLIIYYQFFITKLEITKTANKDFLNILTIESIAKAHWQRNVICTQPHNFFLFL